jgi:antitoxin component of MazEF toxin-antitoxin module
MHFQATVQLDGKTATGINVPDHVVQALGGGNRPPVRVTLAGYSYRTTVARMGGQFKFPISAAVREQAGVAAGDRVDIEIELDTSPREVEIPPALAAVLDANPDAKVAFGKLSYSNQRRHVLAVEGAKTDETRQRRLQKIVSELTTQSG